MSVDHGCALQLHLFSMQRQQMQIHQCFNIDESSISRPRNESTWCYADDVVELGRRMAAGEFGSVKELFLVSYTCFGAAIDVTLFKLTRRA